MKELSWCSKSASPNMKSTGAAVLCNTMTPIDRFGIIAAMSNNRIIGLNGKIPWNISEDRTFFKSMTTGKILVIGRKTLEEDSNFCHVLHTAKCIVISKTLRKDQIDTTSIISGTEILIARSFLEALHLAREQTELKPHFATSNINDVDCWIAGGERVYIAAVLHPSAWNIHLTVVDADIDTCSNDDVARFPPKYHWDSRFQQTSAEAKTTADGLITFTHYTFNRKIYNRQSIYL